jgi:hypothetical protein
MKCLRFLLLACALIPAISAAQSKGENSLSKVNRIYLSSFDEIWGKVCTGAVDEPEGVSLIQLIANPKHFEGKPVQVIGYYHSGGSPLHSYSAVFLHKEDFEQRNIANSVWISAPRNSTIKDGYVLISGIFSQRVSGDLGNWNSGICNVKLLERWEPEKNLYGRE